MNAVERIAAMRAEQVERWGHTPDADLNLPLKVLPDRSIRKIVAAQEDMHFRRGDWRAQALKHLAQAGALLAAAIDRLEAEDADPCAPATTTSTGEPI